MARPPLPVPIAVLEAVHEERLKSGLSIRKAIVKTLPRFERSLPGKPFERVRKAYRKFEKEIGDKPLEDYRFEDYLRRQQAARHQQEAQARERLAELEREAEEVLGSTDPNNKSLRRIVAAWEEEEMLELRSLFDGSPAHQAQLFAKRYGSLPQAESLEKRRRLTA